MAAEVRPLRRGLVQLALGGALVWAAASGALLPTRGHAAGMRHHAVLQDDGTASPVSNATIVRTALQYLGYPYTTVGNNPKDGFSCIGFVSYVYQSNGIDLPDDLNDALNFAPKVSFSKLEPGDLLFFQNTVWKGLSHVALYLGHGLMIHAEWYNRGVVISSIKNDPVDGNYWVGKYLGANRPWTGANEPLDITIPTPSGLAPTPTPTPVTTPTPADEPSTTVSAWLLNLRASPSTKADVITVLHRGAQLTILGSHGSWLHVQLPNEVSGWVVARGVGAVPAVKATSTPEPVATNVVTLTMSYLHLRKGPSLSSPILTTIHQGDRLTILKTGAGWIEVRTAGGRVGWVSAPLLLSGSAPAADPPAAPAATATPTPTATVTATLKKVGTTPASSGSTAVTTAPLRLHTAPNLKAKVITVIKKGTRVRVLRHASDWSLIRLADGTTGYAATAYLK